MTQAKTGTQSAQIPLPTGNFLSWGYWFGEIDTRWLSVFRICIALLMLKDALYHLPLAHIFYSDEGIIPRWELFNGLVRDRRFSLMDAIGQPWMAILFFCVWIIVLLCLVAGYRTRLMTILNFIIILSVHERNGYILTSADTLMRAMSFWMMFAAIGQYYSIDALRQRWRRFRETDDAQQLQVEDAPRTAFALPIRLIQLQLVMLYISTAFLKAISPIWQRGETLHYITQIDTFILPPGAWMRAWSPELLRFASYFSLNAEIAIPILLLMPILWRWSRLSAFALALILHGGIAIALSIPDFSLLMLICYLPFFAPEWLQWLEKRAGGATQQITIAPPSDPHSPLWIIISLTNSQEVKIGDETQAANAADDWEIQLESEIIRGQLAWKHISDHLAFARLWNWILNIKAFRNLLWWIMAATVRRYQNKAFPPKNDSQVSWFDNRLRLSVVLIPLFLLLIMFNIEATGRYIEGGFRYPRPIQGVWDNAQNIIWYTGLWQYWDMFSPTPIQYDGWIVIEGQFEDGTSYDLITGEPVDYDTPTRWYWGPNMRWEKFEENVYQGRRDALLRGWGSYYCRIINENRVEGTRLATLQIRMVYTNFHAPNELPNNYQTDQLWFHWCYEQYAPQS